MKWEDENKDDDFYLSFIPTINKIVRGIEIAILVVSIISLIILCLRELR